MDGPSGVSDPAKSAALREKSNSFAVTSVGLHAACVFDVMRPGLFFGGWRKSHIGEILDRSKISSTYKRREGEETETGRHNYHYLSHRGQSAMDRLCKVENKHKIRNTKIITHQVPHLGQLALDCLRIIKRLYIVQYPLK